MVEHGYCMLDGVILLMWKDKPYTFTDVEVFRKFMNNNGLS